MTLRLWLTVGAAVSTLALLGYVGHLQRANTTLTTANAALSAKVGTLEAVRTQDQQNATSSYNRQQENCRADVVAAIKGGQTLGRILSTPDPAPGAPRGIVGSDELRDLIGEHADP